MNTRITRDLELMAQLVSGGKAGEAALESLFRAYRRPLLLFLRGRGMSLEQAEDVVQGVFEQLLHKAHTFRGESALSSWLYTLARNLAVSMHRSQAKEFMLDEEGWREIEASLPTEDDPSPLGTCDPKVALQECYEKAYALFAKSHPAAAEAIYLVVEHDWSGQDLAKHLNRAYGATREYLSQCKKKLKQFMEPCRQYLTP